jgi:hypothetical protein
MKSILLASLLALTSGSMAQGQSTGASFTYSISWDPPVSGSTTISLFTDLSKPPVWQKSLDTSVGSASVTVTEGQPEYLIVLAEAADGSVANTLKVIYLNPPAPPVTVYEPKPPQGASIR